MNDDSLVLHKFVGFETAKIVLVNRTLRWSTPETLNDPFDMQFELRLPADEEAVREATLYKMWQVYLGNISPDADLGRVFAGMGHLLSLNLSQREFWEEFSPAIDEGVQRIHRSLPELRHEISESMKNTKVLCLTKDPANPTMWAHYADNQSGVVLSFRNYEGGDSPIKVAKPIRYVDEIPAWLDVERLSDILAGLNNFDPMDAIDTLVYTKGRDWSYEREWRIYSGDGRDRNARFEDISFDARELCGIIVGLKMSNEDRSLISKLVSEYPNAKMYQARLGTGLRHEIIELD